MKQFFLILFSAFFITSCRQKAEDPELATEQLKARVKMQEKVNKVVNQLRADCDSNLLQSAIIKADSIKAAKTLSHKKTGRLKI